MIEKNESDASYIYILLAINAFDILKKTITIDNYSALVIYFFE